MADRPTFGERTITLPGGFSLSDAEIAHVLARAEATKKAAEHDYDLTADPTSPEWFTLKVPVTARLTREEIIHSLNQLERAKGHAVESSSGADVLFTFHTVGATTQMGRGGWITLKSGPPAAPRIELGGTRVREF